MDGPAEKVRRTQSEPIGIELKHILDDGGLETNADLEKRLLRILKIPQLQWFNLNPNDKKYRAKVNPPGLNPGTPLANCIRCGTCCKKGGPSFHQADKHLIEKGLIHSKYLYTLRKGELAYDNVKECLMPVNSDIVKIKGKKFCPLYHY